MTNYQNLSDKELLQLIIRERNGQVVDQLFTEFNSLPEVLVHSEEKELTNLKGIGQKTAEQIKAIYELTRRLYQVSVSNIITISSPADVSKLLMAEMRYLKQEHFKVILLNTKNAVLSVETVSIGALNASLVHPRDVFRLAVKVAAASIILVHQHPSGDPTPSNEDKQVTQRLVEIGKIMGIEVLDHIILGAGVFFSFKEKGLI